MDDTIVFLGDAIDRGPQSREVLNLMLELQDQCHVIAIFGNHEQMLLDARDGQIPLHDWLIHGGAETLDSYGRGAGLDKVPQEHIDFLRSWCDYYETPGFFYAHGNFLAEEKLADQPWEWLRWESLRESTPARHCSGKTAILGHTSNKRGQIINLGHLICIDTYCHGGGWLTALEPENGHVWQANLSGTIREGELSPVQKAE